MSNVVHCNQVAGWRFFGDHSVQKCPFKIDWKSVAEKCYSAFVCVKNYVVLFFPLQIAPGVPPGAGGTRAVWKRKAFLTISTIFLCLAPGSRGEKSNLNDFFFRFSSPGASKTRALPNLQGGVQLSLTCSNVGHKNQDPVQTDSKLCLVTLQSCWGRHSQTCRYQEHSTQPGPPEQQSGNLHSW